MLTVLLTLAIVGFIVYLLITYIPMPAAIRTTIIVIVVIVLIIWLLGLIGFRDVPVPQLR